jgi:hypothetical protein
MSISFIIGCEIYLSKSEIIYICDKEVIDIPIESEIGSILVIPDIAK